MTPGDILIARIFLPLASPGLAMMGPGVLAIAKGTYDTIQLAAVVVGLLVVAVAGVFTIRSNVAKIWREQAEGEKAKNEALVQQIAEAAVTHTKECADLRASFTEEIARIRAEADEQRELKHNALTELAAANMRTDLGPLLVQFGAQHKEVLGRLDKLTEALNAPR